MSVKKYQLKDLVSSLSAEANKNKDPEVKARFYLIKAVVSSDKDVKKTCEGRGTSTDTFYKWGDRLLKSRNLSALKSLSKTVKYFWNRRQSKNWAVKLWTSSLPHYASQIVIMLTLMRSL